MIEPMDAARRRRHVGPSANQENNKVVLLVTKKILFSLASRPAMKATPMENSHLGHSCKY